MHRSHGLGQHAVAPPASAAPGALILGGAHGSLAVARSLGRRGIPVFFLTHDHPIAKFSRYATHHRSWLGPNQNGGLEQLLAFGRNGHNGWVLIPGGDAEVEFVARHHDALSQVFCATMPLWEVVKWACDKRLTYARAASLGIPCPRTVYPKDRRELAALDLTFPLILKPMVRDQVNEFTSAKAWRADSKQELLRRYDRAAALVPPETIALQELIPGGSESQFSYAAVCVAGTPVASLVARRTRQYPIEFGYTSTLVETVRQDEVEQLSERFLRSLNYDGFAEVEFKYDARERVFKLLDFNARPWTWIGLGAKAGVDLPWVFWQAAAGETVSPAKGHVACAWMHVSRDIVAACQLMLKGRLSPRTYWRSWQQPLAFAAFAWDDPLPGILDLALTLWRQIIKRAGRAHDAVGSRAACPRLSRPSMP